MKPCSATKQFGLTADFMVIIRTRLVLREHTGRCGVYQRPQGATTGLGRFPAFWRMKGSGSSGKNSGGLLLSTAFTARADPLYGARAYY
jgi:hypothetical protein